MCNLSFHHSHYSSCGVYLLYTMMILLVLFATIILHHNSRTTNVVVAALVAVLLLCTLNFQACCLQTTASECVVYFLGFVVSGTYTYSSNLAFVFCKVYIAVVQSILASLLKKAIDINIFVWLYNIITLFCICPKSELLNIYFSRGSIYANC